MKNLILLIALVIFVSCGTRKTNKTKTDIVTTSEKVVETLKTEDATKEKSTEAESSEVNSTVNNVIDENENLEPINPDKPMIKTTETKDGKTKTTYENAKVNSKKTTDNSISNSSINSTINTSEVEKSRKSEGLKINEKAKTEIVDTSKSSKRINLSWWWLIVLIPVAIGAYYYSRRK